MGTVLRDMTSLACRDAGSAQGVQQKGNNKCPGGYLGTGLVGL